MFNPISLVITYAHSSSQSQQALQSAPADIGTTCSDDSLKTVAGVADCTTVCAAAECCQTDIGSADCGFTACLSYANDCMKLASLMGIDVPDGADAADAADAADGGDTGDSGLVEDDEMTSTGGDTNSTGDVGDGDGTTGTDGDEQTGGGGTFDNPEDCSILDALGTAADNVKDTFKTAMTDPSSLSTGQIIGIAIGSLVALCLLICLVKCCCCRKKSDQ